MIVGGLMVYVSYYFLIEIYKLYDEFKFPKDWEKNWKMIKLHPFYSSIKGCKIIKDFINNNPIASNNSTSKKDLIENNNNWYIGNKLCYVSQNTGGTSGKSAKIYMTLKHAQIMAETFFWSYEETGCVNKVKIFNSKKDRFLVFYPQDSYFQNIYNFANNKLKLKYITKFSAMKFNKIDKQTVFDLVKEINEFKPKLLAIFPFVLLQVCIIINKEKIKLTHIPLVNISGEFVCKNSIKYCQKLFPIINSTYGLVEFGEIAHQYNYGEDYECNDNFKVELNNKNEICVTSLYQFTFPLIRYNTGDIADEIVEKEGKQFIKNLQGKNTQFVNELTPIKLDAIMSNYDIIQYRMLIKNKNNATVQYVGNVIDNEIKEIRGKIKGWKLLEFKKYELIPHDFTKKFKIIQYEDDDETVGNLQL